MLPQYGRQYYCGYVYHAKFGQKSVSHSLHMKPITVWLDPIWLGAGRVCMYVCMYVCMSLFSVIFLHYTFENIFYLFTPPLCLPSDFVFYYCFPGLHYRQLFEVSWLFSTIFSAGCVSLTYFDFLWLGDRFSGLLSPESNPTKYPISPWLRYSRSRCYCYNLQVGLGFLFFLGFLVWSG